MNSRRYCFVPVLLIVLLVGCGRSAEVTTQSVVRQEEPRRPVDVEAIKKLMHHTLVAILPSDEVAWFFKISGPAESVEAVKDDFVEFIGTLKASESKGAPPSWTLPDDWLETGPAPMRAATIKLPAEKGEVEITVSSLPLTGQWEDFLYMNVERWMRQLRQGPLSQETIQKLAEQVETDAGKATVLHLAGMPPVTERPNPHAGMAKKPAAQSPASKQSEEKPAASPTGKGPLQYVTPQGWKPSRMNVMRKAAFDIEDGDQRAELTVTNFPADAGPMMTDPAANIQRWASQVGITDFKAKDIDQVTEPIEIDGHEGLSIELFGPEEGERPLAILVVMLTRDDKIWFFKLFGDRSTVEAQQEAFSAFLKSVSFK